MKVSLDVLQRVYDAFQEENNETGESDYLDPEGHLFFVDAFEMPLWNWSTERSGFERSENFTVIYARHSLLNRVLAPLTLSGSAESRVAAIRNRLNIIKQTVLRNDHFSPSTITARDRERLLTVG